MSVASSSEQSVRTVCPYCGVGCGMVLKVRDGRVVSVAGDRLHPANFGRLCSKGATCAETLSVKDRLAYAHARRSRAEPFLRVGMDDAIQRTAEGLGAVIAAHGPDAVALYVSGQLSLEAQYLANKLCKGFLRTNNIESNSRLCMSSAASGYKLSLGADGPPGAYADIERSDLLFVIGSNMAECHPILFSRVLDRKKQGARLIVADPRKTPTGEKADLHLPVSPGTDLALLNGLLHLLVKDGRVDPEFIARHTEGWDELAAFLEPYTPGFVSGVTGLDERDIRLAARWFGEAPEAMTFWTMGLNQSIHGTWHTNAICNLHLATGKIGRPGSGPFSLTGQPNAMGGREVGYMGHALPGQRVVGSAEDRAFVEDLWEIPRGSIGAAPGPDTVELFRKIQAGAIKALWVIGSNPAVTLPRRNEVLDALARADLLIVQDAYHPTETTRCADILLPGAVWAEAEGVMINSERNATLMRKAVEPPGKALPDWEIIARVARAMGHGRAFAHRTAAEVFEEITRAHNPRTGYDLRGISHRRLREGPVQWPCGPREKQGRPRRYLPEGGGPAAGGGRIRFPTDSGRARFLARPHLPPAEMPDREFPFVFTTGRCAHQWHTMTKTGHVAQLNKLNPAPFVEIHPEDAEALGVKTGDPVEIHSRRGRARLPARVTGRIRPGCCFAPFHWNDLHGENLAVNTVTHDAVDPLSRQPGFKFCAVKLLKAAAPAPPSPAQETAGIPGTRFLSLVQQEYRDGLLTGWRVAGLNAPVELSDEPENRG